LWARLSAAGPEDSAAQYRFLLSGLRQEAAAAVRAAAGDVTGAQFYLLYWYKRTNTEAYGGGWTVAGVSGARTEQVKACAALRGEVSRVAALLQESAAALSRHAQLLRCAQQHLWIDPDEARAAQQLLLPKAAAALEEVEAALADARSLVLALQDREEEAAAPANELRLAVLELLWEDGEEEAVFSAEELGMGMKEAKAKYDAETFRRWKRARKKM
jgi:hypothetical protein